MKRQSLIKKFCPLFLIVLLLLGTGGAVLAQDGTGSPVEALHIEVSVPVCGKAVTGGSPQDCRPAVTLEEINAAEPADPCAWVSGITETNPSSYVPFQGVFAGDEAYQALVTIKALPGHSFNESTKVLCCNPETWEYEEIEPLLQERDRIIFSVSRIAEHDWSHGQYVHEDPTCASEGSDYFVCGTDPSHTLTKTLPADPSLHVWGDWRVIKEATETQQGERVRTCSLCGFEERETIASLKVPYAEVYEPITSWPMAATVAWKADDTALQTAEKEVRPATAFVWLDSDLKVYDRDGGIISEDIDSYVNATAGRVIPAFYIKDKDTAEALKEWLSSSGLLDCFVVSAPENRNLVKDVADLLHVRGMLDFTMVRNPDKKAIANMIACVNSSHGKVVLLSSEAASRETIHKMQSLSATVWAEAPGDLRTLMTLYTNGVNGVVTDDYETAISAVEFFQDDAPSLLRVPQIIGHRGDPSSFPENTLDSAIGAYREGVDSVENDIQLSSDGELFIYHDNSANRFLGITKTDEKGDMISPEKLTLAEIQSRPFRWSDIIGYNEVSADSSRFGSLHGQSEAKDYSVPTFREFLQSFKETEMVHDTEIKSSNPAIVPVLKAIVDEYEAWDQVFTITLNESILDTIYNEYPEISIGALGDGKWTEIKYADFDAITANEGAEAALKALYDTIDQWNATYNPGYEGYGEAMVKAGRHRGLTVWPWTYKADADFARDYLNAVTGMTTDYPWVASDYITEIRSEDVSSSSVKDIPKPAGVTRDGEVVTLEDAEPVSLEKLSATETLMLWRFRADLDVNGKSYGNYYLYSNPFVFTKAGVNDDSFVPYVDVPEDAYFAEPVSWAHNTGVTKGLTDSDFAPDEMCTRAQVITFLWRAMNKPEPEADVNPFVDINEDNYFYQAVLWGVEKGITGGTDETHFSPDEACTRAQAVSFLWRMHGSADPEPEACAFKDVPVTAYYGKAVRWATDQGIASGTDEMAFSPDQYCSRAQIVTFLHRDLAGKIIRAHFRSLFK